MKNLLNLILNIGKLKRKQRKGWTVLHQIKNSESTADHSFRMAMLAWILGRKTNLDLNKIIKLALLHDLCEVYAEDETPYDPLLPKDMDRKKIEEIRKKRSRLQYTQEQREARIKRKFNSELSGLDELIKDLPQDLKAEFKGLWLDFAKGLSPEARFVKQIDKTENLLQALEYWQEQGQIERDMWILASGEWCHDDMLAEFLQEVDKSFRSQTK